MERINFYGKVYRMGKIKVVEIENDVPAPEPSSIEAEPPSPTQPEYTQVEIPKSEEAPITVIAEKPKATKEKKLEYVTCDVCNKSMLTKTYKYSHQKLCKPEAPPPPPPPTPEPRPKRAAKAKAAPKAAPIEVYQDPPKQTWDGRVSFNNVRDTPPQPSVADLYNTAREQRQQVRTSRVKSLISQAI